MFYHIFEALDRKFGVERTQAHCDIPCGIYDPSTAQIAALTVVRMMDLMAEAEAKGHDNHANFINSMARYIAVKEEHAEKAKHEIRVIWGDYLKPEHLEKYPELNGLVFKIMKLGSKVRQSADRQTGLDFIEAINQFATIFWETKNVAIKRAKAPYAPALEMVYPVL